jgi:hypothetical protein
MEHTMPYERNHVKKGWGEGRMALQPCAFGSLRTTRSEHQQQRQQGSGGSGQQHLSTHPRMTTKYAKHAADEEIA